MAENETRFEQLSIDQVMSETQGDVAFLMQRVGQSAPQLQASAVSNNLMTAVQILARDESCLARGEFLSRVMRLPPMWRNSVMEYIGGGKPYGDSRLRVEVTIQNCGKVSVSYLRAMTAVTIPDRNTGAPTDRQAIHKLKRILEPGDRVTLESDRAVDALWEYGLHAQSTYLWAQHAPRIADRPLVEVAYKAQWFDSTDRFNAAMAEVDSASWQVDRVAEIVARAEAAGSQSEARVVLAEAKPWWPKSDAYTSILTRSGGEAVDSEPSRRRRVA